MRSPGRNALSRGGGAAKNRERRSHATTYSSSGGALRFGAPLRRLHPHGGAAVQRGTRESKKGPRRSRCARKRTVRSGKSQSPYPSLAAGGCHMVAAAAISGARTLPRSRKAAKECRATPTPSAPAAESRTVRYPSFISPNRPTQKCPTTAHCPAALAENERGHARTDTAALRSRNAHNDEGKELNHALSSKGFFLGPTGSLSAIPTGRKQTTS